MNDHTLSMAAEDIAQREQRRRGLLDYAAECEREAWDLPPGGASSELYEEAHHARLAARALPVDG